MVETGWYEIPSFLGCEIQKPSPRRLRERPESPFPIGIPFWCDGRGWTDEGGVRGFGGLKRKWFDGQYFTFEPLTSP